MTQSTAFKRLLSSANFVRAGAVFADIGTDHGYLPIFLLKEGKISRAVLSDVNEGPLASARENVEAAGLSHLAEFYLTDGAAALAGLGITDYAICGMGGELIRDIIDRAPHLAERGVRLILQPMSKQEILRRYLVSCGFSILEESYTSADGKYYLTILAEYTSDVRELSEVDAILGRLPDVCDVDCYVGYLEKKRASYERAVRGRIAGGEDNPAQSAILSAIDERLRTVKKWQV